MSLLAFVASRVPGPVRLAPPSAATRLRPGGSDPFTCQEPILIVLLTPKITGCIAVPAGSVRLGWLLDSIRFVAPLRALIAPRAAAVAAVDRSTAPTGEIVT